MANPIYRQTLAEAWRITRRHKFLWFFGFFAILLNSGVASGIETFFNNLSFFTTTAGEDLQKARVLYENNTIAYILSNIRIFFQTITLENILTLVLIIGIFIFFIWISTVSQGALITATDTFRQGKLTTPEASFTDGTRLFWPIFWLNVLKYICTTGVLIILGAPLLSLYLVREQELWVNLLLILGYVIMVPIGMIIAFLLQFASAYVALRKQKLSTAIASAWRMFSHHWLATLEMGGILFLIYFVATAIISIVFLPQILNLYLNTASGLLPGLAGYMNISFIALAVIAIFLTCIFSTFQYVATTLFFLKVEEGAMTSKLIRWFSHWGNVGDAPKTPALKTVK